MNQMLVDGLMQVSFVNGVVRLECGSFGHDGKLERCGFLIIPGNQAGPILQSFANAIQEVAKLHREKTEQAQANPSSPPN